LLEINMLILQVNTKKANFMFNNPGNKYAEKWTAEAVKDCLARIEEEANKEDTNFLGTALMRLRISRRSWSYWRQKFMYEEEIIEQMELIDEIFESKLSEGGLNGTLKTGMVIFCLKNNYGWSDKRQNEQSEIGPPQQKEPLVVCKLKDNEELRVPYPSLPRSSEYGENKRVESKSQDDASR